MTEETIRILVQVEGAEKVKDLRDQIQRVREEAEGTGVGGGLRGSFLNISGALLGLGKVANSVGGIMRSALLGMGKGLLHVGEIAAGILVAGAIKGLFNQFMELANGAIQAAGSMQQYGIAFQTLVARELMRGEEVTRVVTTTIHLTDKEREKLADLQKARQEKVEQLGLEQEALRLLQARVEQLTQKYGAEDLRTQQAVLSMKRKQEQIGDLQEAIAEYDAQISALQAKEGQLAQTLERVRVNQMGFAEALAQAAPKAQELLNYLRDLALVSPYTFPEVVDAMRFTMAMGASLEMAKRLTGAMITTASALGLNNEQFYRLYYNLAQAIQAGDLTAMNLRQLRNVGLDLSEVLQDRLGMSIEQVRDALKSGKLTAKDVGEAFIGYANTYFAGAAKRMAYSFTGLRSNFKDLLFFIGADMLGVAVDKASKWLGGLFDVLRGMVEEGYFKRLGEEIGNWLNPILERLTGLLQTLKTEGIEGVLKKLGVPQGAIDGMKQLASGTWSLVNALVALASGPAGRVAVGILSGLFGALGGIAGGLAEVTGGLLQGKTLEQLREPYPKPRVEHGHIPEEAIAMREAVAETAPLTAWQKFWRIEVPAALKTVQPYLKQIVGPLKGIGDEFRDWWSVTGPGVIALLRALGKILGWLATNVLVPVLTFVFNAIRNILRVVMGIISVIVGVLTGNADLIKDGVDRILKGIFDLVDGLVATIAGILKSLGTIVWDHLEPITDTVGGFLNRLWNTIWNWVTTNAAKFWEASKTLVGSLLDGAKEKWNDVSTWARGLVNEIIGIILEQVYKLREAGKTILTGFWNGMRDIWNSIVQWWNDNVVGIYNKLKDVFDFHSPSRTMYWAGRNIMEGFYQGLSYRPGAQYQFQYAPVITVHAGQAVVDSQRLRQYLRNDAAWARRWRP